MGMTVGAQGNPGIEVRGFEDRLEPDDDGGFLAASSSASAANTRLGQQPAPQDAGGLDPWGHLQGQAQTQGQESIGSRRRMLAPQNDNGSMIDPNIFDDDDDDEIDDLEEDEDEDEEEGLDGFRR